MSTVQTYFGYSFEQLRTIVATYEQLEPYLNTEAFEEVLLRGKKQVLIKKRDHVLKQLDDVNRKLGVK